MSAHSSSDDPSRYRDESVTEEWRTTRDPIERVRRFMERRGWLDAAGHAAVAAEIEDQVRAVIARQEAAGPPAIDTLIEDVYEDVPQHLRQQLEQYYKGE